MITSLEQLDLNKKYTYADYLTWQLDDMVELIKGKIYKMSPAPSRRHQRISGDLYGFIWQYLRTKECQVYDAPFDVRLPLPESLQKKDKIDTVVQPDICVICDLEKLDDRGCNGAPDWIIEILSLSTKKKDLNEKFDIYQNAGVKEYWIVSPNDETILAYKLNEQNQYEPISIKPFTEETINSFVFPDLVIDLSDLFSR